MKPISNINYKNKTVPVDIASGIIAVLERKLPVVTCNQCHSFISWLFPFDNNTSNAGILGIFQFTVMKNYPFENS